jgi:uncharacterized protein YndB with AHSA1/START domain
VPEGVHETVELAAPRQVVWDLVMDPRRLGEWVSAHRKLGELPELPLGEGDSFKQKLGVGPVRFSVTWEVTEARPPELARWHGRGPGGSTAEITYRLEEAGEGATRFVYMNDYELPGGVAGRAAKKAVSAAAGSREARRSLARLERVLDGG